MRRTRGAVNIIPFLAAAVAPLVASAQTTPSNFCDIISIVNTVVTWFGIAVFIVSVVAILYSAFLFLTAGGAEDKVKVARTVLVYGLIGIAVALLATNAAAIVKATTGGTNVFATCVASFQAAPTLTQ